MGKDEFALEEHVSLCQPAVRMVVVEGYACDDDGELTVGHEIMPVVAIKSELISVYENESHHHPGSVDPARLADEGWEFKRRHTRIYPLVITENQYLIGLDELRADYDCEFSDTSRCCELIACGWDQCRDDAELEPVISRVKEKAAGNLRRVIQRHLDWMSPKESPFRHRLRDYLSEYLASVASEPKGEPADG
jgi:hypothetical protein